ncbi:hypothetical protein M9H77_33385 [Catharanthus roseus]|uniref:Uncharacterized protein n=1 Tax=Catharanthus roseus TaxID=4058 RepID=A0ACB9ZLR8_CATRO|nr:hypothetical protein M9H77_33385 [Catharanthus roseus]
MRSFKRKIFTAIKPREGNREFVKRGKPRKTGGRAVELKRSSKGEMEVSSLPISASQRGKLISAGYSSLSSLAALSPTHLSRDLGVSESEAIGILKAVSQRVAAAEPERIDGSNHAIVNGEII